MTALLKELTVADLLKTKKSHAVHTIHAQTSLFDAAILMKNLNVGLLVVTATASKPPEVVGVLSERDIVRRAVAVKMDLHGNQVATIMTKSPIFTSTSETIEDCLIKFKTYHCRHLPVGAPDNPLVDVLSERDLMAFLMEKFQDQNSQLLTNLSFSND